MSPNAPPALTAQGKQPGLAVILVGDSQASQVYVRNKVKAMRRQRSVLGAGKYDANLSEADLLARITALNADPKSMAIWCSCRCRRISMRTR